MKYFALWFVFTVAFVQAQQQPIRLPNGAQQGAVNASGAGDQPPPPAVRPEDKCTIEGTVVNALTGEALKKAHLSLRPIGQANATPYGTVTDNAGHFLLDDLDPGRYSFSATRNGFVTQAYSPQGNSKRSTTLTLANGQRLKEIVFKLTPQGVITGRITDEEGEPLANVTVQTLMYSYQRGKRQLVPANGGSTNDLGEFRIHGLRPGKYVVSATYRSQDMMASQPERTVGGAPAVLAAEEGYVTTYYPNTTNPETASQLDVTAGGQVQGISLTLTRTRTVRIKGHLLGLGDASIARRTTIMLLPKDSGMMFMPRAFARPQDAKGSFEMRGISPGSYTLSADMIDETRRYSARLAIEVGNSNLEGIELRLQPPAELPGKLVIEENGDLQGASLSVNLQGKSSNIMMGGAGGVVKEDMTFKLANIGPDPYDVNVYGLPEGFYLKAIRLGTQDVTDAGLDFTQGVVASELAIVINPNGGQIEGVVQNAKGENAAGATVTLIPDSAHRAVSWLYKTANSDQNGHFTIKGVKPGEYTIYAWEEIESGAYQDPEFMKPHESVGVSVSVKQSGHDTLQLKAIPAENSGGKATN